MRLRKVLTLLGVFMAGAYLFPIVLVGKGSIAFLFLGEIVRALYPPIMRFYVNSNVGDAFRATVISIVSLSRVFLSRLSHLPSALVWIGVVLFPSIW